MNPRLTVVAALALAGCGGGSSSPDPVAASSPTSPAAAPAATSAAAPAAARSGTRIVLADSPFGKIVWGPRRQAVYAFERDGRNRSRCYGECARLWPPVYAKGRPDAGPGLRQELIGTTRRRDGRRQVTYGGRPLYYYAHEGAGEVRCHNVDLNGGLWWVIDARGKPRP